MKIRARAAMAVFASLRTWVIALFLFGTVPAFAANPNPISESQAQQLGQNVVRMQDTVLNLLEMAKPAVGAEQLALLLIANSGTPPLFAVDRVAELADIYQNMTSEKDKAYVAGGASTALENAKRQLDVGVTGINGQVIYLTSPAAIAEVQRLRDLMREVRQRLDQYHY
jgi:hypothetical protein